MDINREVPSTRCHDGQLKQVVVNLIVNAVQAMPNGGELAISLSPEPLQSLGTSAVRLTVRDSGMGIDPAHRSRLFDPFLRRKTRGPVLGARYRTFHCGRPPWTDRYREHGGAGHGLFNHPPSSLSSRRRKS